MGIYIKGMEMPSGCPYCPLSHWENREFMGCEVVIGKGRAVKTDKEYSESPAASRPEWCPLVHVPSHGRLIDGDAIVRKIKSICGAHWTTAEIERAPTIIPAEEGET